MFTKLYESQKGLCEDRSLIFSTKHFVPDLRLAKYYPQHIRSMVTTNLSNGERPQGFSPPLIWCSFNTLHPAILMTMQDSFYLQLSGGFQKDVINFFLKYYRNLL